MLFSCWIISLETNFSLSKHSDSKSHRNSPYSSSTLFVILSIKKQTLREPSKMMKLVWNWIVFVRLLTANLLLRQSRSQSTATRVLFNSKKNLFVGKTVVDLEIKIFNIIVRCHLSFAKSHYLHLQQLY